VIGLYVTVEGVDAVGKTTLIGGLVAHYRAVGALVAVKPEFPARMHIDARINQSLERSIFIGEGFDDGPAAAFFFMIYAEMTAMSMLPPAADLIFADRGLDSLCLYQGFSVRGRDKFDARQVVTAIEAVYDSLGIRLPSRTLLLTLPASYLSERFRARNDREPSPGELELLVWLQEQFLVVAAERPRFAVLDARDAADSVLGKAIQEIDSWRSAAVEL
jgi:thymidylate kinase